MAATSLLLILTACQSITVEPPAIVEIEHKIVAPPKDGPIVVAVYSFQDKTGQRKDGGNVAKLSSAVTQGGETILIEALQDVGDRKDEKPGDDLQRGQWQRIIGIVFGVCPSSKL